jgi:hypothetical protein
MLYLIVNSNMVENSRQWRKNYYFYIWWKLPLNAVQRRHMLLFPSCYVLEVSEDELARKPWHDQNLKNTFKMSVKLDYNIKKTWLEAVDIGTIFMHFSGKHLLSVLLYLQELATTEVKWTALNIYHVPDYHGINMMITSIHTASHFNGSCLFGSILLTGWLSLRPLSCHSIWPHFQSGPSELQWFSSYSVLPSIVSLPPFLF